MDKRQVCLVFGVLFLCSCSGDQTAIEQIDISTQQDLGIELVLEIGESEEFIPGNLRDLVLVPNGSLLVSDWGNTAIEQFSFEGIHQGTVAIEGGGPGELSSYFSMYNAGYDSVVVRHQQGRKDFFGQDESGRFSFVRSIINDTPTDRPITFVGVRSETEFYATAGSVIRDVDRAISNPRDYRMAPLVIVDSGERIVADSLHLLKTPMPHLTGSASGGITIREIPYRYYDRFLPMENGRYMIARPDSSALFVYNRDHEPEKRIPLAIVPRPVTSSDFDYALGRHARDVRREIEARILDWKPPYLNIWLSEDCIWLYTDTSEEGKEVVVLDFEGNPLGKFLLPDMDEIKFVKDKRVYTIHKDPEVGDSIRVYEAGV